jgi:phage terminase small subunit
LNEEKNYILAESDYVAGMKYKDIAAKYEVSINTVKSWKKRYAWSRNKKTGCIQKGCTQNKKGAHKKEAVAEDVSQVVINDELTDQQQLFCLYQSRMFNYTKAYMKAYPGCTYASAAVLGSRLMKNPVIRKEIEQLKQNHMNRELLKQEDIFQKYMDIATVEQKAKIEQIRAKTEQIRHSGTDTGEDAVQSWMDAVKKARESDG